ncbi:MAG: sulfatase-like hydrolase/transferase [Bacteroidales bacterium]|nr:sulfatase-like hydrolase/transferase [Bacteroidales bacterium]
MIIIHNYFVAISLTIVAMITLGSCISGNKSENNSGLNDQTAAVLADEMKESLFLYILNPWYPRNIDTVSGGYISAFNHDWSLSEDSQMKALVQQARHLWTTAHVAENYPDSTRYLEYAAHGFSFLQETMWDKESGGFHAYCNRDGTGIPERIHEKRIYGQAFAVYALAQYYRVSQDPDALVLAKKAFQWMEDHAHDPLHGGYYEFLWRNGTPMTGQDSLRVTLGDTPGIGLKDYNSSIHIMEAFTELYRIWPDALVRTRLEEMFLLIRDTFTHPDGYLQLYFYPDWTLVPEEEMEKRSPDNHWYTRHFTYGHDVESAFLLLETAHALGLEEDEKTHRIAKKLVDHSLESGWDREAGGFFDAGRELDGKITIINRNKSWWGLVEGMNALLLMHRLYPDDPADYGQKFLKSWEHIDAWLIDKEHGGWYNAALDTSPESAMQGKSHIWKTTYHNTRGMLSCIHMLRRSEAGTRKASRPEPPNIVFILADDMGHSDPGCYGSEILETPHIDALAAGGLRFTNFYNTGRCWPTRTSLLSGYYSHQVLSDPMPGVDYSDASVLPVNSTWLPAILKRQGYHTYHSGKWHILRKVPVQSQMSHAEVGFDHSYRTEDGRHLRPRHLWEDGKEIPLPEEGSDYEASVAIVDHAIRYLEEHHREHSQEPFFEYIAFIAPHFPLQALQEDIDKYREKYLPGWDKIRKMRTENRKALGFEVHQVNPLEPERFAPWNLTPEELITRIDSAETGRAEAPGISLLPVLQQDIESDRPPIFFHHENKKVLRDGNWKIVTIEDGGEWELYDLSKDRGETNNLAERHPEKLRELVSLWEARRKQIIGEIGATDLL